MRASLNRSAEQSLLQPLEGAAFNGVTYQGTGAVIGLTQSRASAIQARPILLSAPLGYKTGRSKTLDVEGFFCLINVYF